ncbi:hypothetical protein [Wolbachia endosymbiont of Brugia malayi]|uniref:hypothetical protein n=1 Tax=Wolbachia endosymbiont of Brugia malayi TaxID=80849 RepID=UPI001CDCE847|nr:hypothetical protein [Wolbachia endosymbiont of Brugia malayi]
MSGKVAAIYLSDGGKVKKDNVVLKIEDHGRAEQVEKARALLKQREVEYDSLVKLSKRGYKAQVQVEAAFTALQKCKS